MLKRLLIILLIFLCSNASAGMLIGSGVESGATCSGNYGYDTAAGTVTAPGAGRLVALRVPLDCDGTISSMSAYSHYADNSSSEVEFGIYADNGSGTDPAALIGNYGAFFDGASSTTKWITDPTIAQAISGEPGYVWLVAMMENGATQLFYDSGSMLARVYVGTWGVWPANWPTGSDIEYTNRDYAIYCTFP